SSVIAATPASAVFDGIDAVLEKLQAATQIGDRLVALLTRAHGLLAGLEGADAKTSAWLDAILTKVDAAGSDASLAPQIASLTDAKTEAHSLLDAAWDATYTGPDGVLHDLAGLTVGPQVGQSVRSVIDGTLAGPLNGLFAAAAPMAAGIDALLGQVKKVVDELDAKIGGLVTGPGSLTDIVHSIEALVH